MQRFKNILLVIDAKTESRAALERVITLAKKNQALLTVVDVIKPLPAFEWVTTIYCGSSHSGCTPRRAAGVKGGEAAEPCEGPLDGSEHRGQMAVR